jgi:EAL domain-containing protein (putative c-di-GMP-specific phosphodiesterase class I)
VGVRIVLDDFGTGYSSLSYLRRFPFAKLKIDQSFMKGLGEDGASDAIVRAILAFAHSLRLEVKAEGVETETQLRMLRHYGCDQVQGFLLRRPGPGLWMVEHIEPPEAAAAGYRLRDTGYLARRLPGPPKPSTPARQPPLMN